jgi:methyl-accepting chemotaxis protein
MDEMTQQNAALVEEATAASQSMVDQAQNMAQLVSFFSMGQAAGAAPLTSSSVSRVATVKAAVKKAKPIKVHKPAAPASSDEWEDF